jgi:hypothetical protein
VAPGSRTKTLSLFLAASDEDLIVYFRSGFAF